MAQSNFKSNMHNLSPAEKIIELEKQVKLLKEKNKRNSKKHNDDLSYWFKNMAEKEKAVKKLRGEMDETRQCAKTYSDVYLSSLAMLRRYAEMYCDIIVKHDYRSVTPQVFIEIKEQLIKMIGQLLEMEEKLTQLKSDLNNASDLLAPDSLAGSLKHSN